MKFDLPLNTGIRLQMSSDQGTANGYPTGRIQKGWLLSCDGHDLSEEAVGFGVPIVKRGLQTIFPGEVKLSAGGTGNNLRVEARYLLNLEEKISKHGQSSLDNRLMYAAKNTLAGMIRGFPRLRSTLTGASNLIRSAFGWQTTYEISGFSTVISLVYTILPSEGLLAVELAGHDLSPGISEVIVMNEQGANHFDEFQDADGTIEHGDQIGCWDEVLAPDSSFISKSSKLSFSLPRVDGTHLFRGRELVEGRLAWSGFGYTFPPDLDRFQYTVTLQRLA